MRKIAFGFAAVATLAASPALAATASNTMPVSVNVINSCTVSATPMAFGTLTSIGGTDVDTTANVNLVCTIGATYDVSMDLGTHAAAGQRYLQSTTDATKTIPYGIFRDAGRLQAWGSTVGTTSTGTSLAGLTTLTAFGRIPQSAASVPAGSYTDTVTVTVTF
ncbi:spore coat protein U-like protein [Novosphingobium kunmingense]|uniref:Spore coat protein U-like protein n=1 Tax=Novosphingobium kunmingense TaxID=1211806 RepID=A0A2N0H514_9SPHN|nr:spore coat U domain-containing protein [Novosphingobium kunmingense]PKB14026.1 spore coat protein U-like protein [Novosphingobium kunmingense]